MKRATVLTLVLLAAALCGRPCLAAEGTSAGPPEHEDLAPSGRGMARGLVNVATGWLEIPRCISYDTTRYHWSYGWAIGAVRGLFVGVARTVVGATDTLSLGVAGDGVHGAGTLPTYAWHSPWVHRDEPLVLRPRDDYVRR